MTTEHVARLRELLREAEAAEDRAREAQKAATPVLWQYTIKPEEKNWYKVYDPTCRLFSIAGKVQNRDAAKAAGHPDHALNEGAMTYVYSDATGHIIMAVGGGTAYIFADRMIMPDGSDVTAFAEIDDFLVENPDGGDITDIVKRHQERRKASVAATRGNRKKANKS